MKRHRESADSDDEPPAKRFRALYDADREQLKAMCTTLGIDGYMPNHVLQTWIGRKTLPAHTNLLPDEIIAHICNYLDCFSMPAFRFTCKRFYRLVNDWIAIQRKKKGWTPLCLLSRCPLADTMIKEVCHTCYLVEKGTESEAVVTKLPLTYVRFEYTVAGNKVAHFPYESVGKCSTHVQVSDLLFTNGFRRIQKKMNGAEIFFQIDDSVQRIPVLGHVDGETKEIYCFTNRCTVVVADSLNKYLAFRQVTHAGVVCENCEVLLKYHTSLIQ